MSKNRLELQHQLENDWIFESLETGFNHEWPHFKGCAQLERFA